jgi:multidrug efflux pump subunit AcrA (membrane-fusion protein)
MFERFKERFARFIAFLGKRPATSFFGLIAVLFGIIALGHFLRTPEQVSEEQVPEPKSSLVFDMSDDQAFVTLPAKVKKESVIHVVALAPGMVTNILTTPGRRVVAGQTLLTLTTDYQSGSAELAKRLTAEQIRLSEELAKIDKDIFALEEKKTRHDSALTDTEQDIALEELKKERATRRSTLEQNALSLQISNVSDAVLKPKTFASGTVQSISVKRGDLVSAGQVLATINAPAGATTLEAFLDPETARLFDPTKEANLTIDDLTLSLLPTYFAQSENENGLFSVLFTLSPDMTSKITNGEFLRMSLPLKKGMPNFTLVPLDAVFQDDQEAWVLVEKDGKAEARKVIVGNLYGSFASILSGLEEHDRILLNRSIIAGDSVSLAQ